VSPKTFPTLYVASCLTGTALCEGMTYSTMHEVATLLFGGDVWTHELGTGPISAAYQAEGYRQFPLMPTREEAHGDFMAAAAKASAAYGATVEVQPGNCRRHADPLTTLGNMVGGKPIIVLAKSEEPRP